MYHIDSYKVTIHLMFAVLFFLAGEIQSKHWRGLLAKTTEYNLTGTLSDSSEDPSGLLSLNCSYGFLFRVPYFVFGITHLASHYSIYFSFSILFLFFTSVMLSYSKNKAQNPIVPKNLLDHSFLCTFQPYMPNTNKINYNEIFKTRINS